LSAKDGPQGESLHGEALHKIAHLEKKQLNVNLTEEERVQVSILSISILSEKCAGNFFVPDLMVDSSSLAYRQECI
jgi:hypothetical protein